jgi:glycerophosphoryl diester phosphodiesterase
VDAEMKEVVPPRAVVMAHRGGEGAPENTLAAFRGAIAAGADYGELDVQETRDGRVGVIHDSNLQRVAGVPRDVWDVTFDELQAIDVGSRVAPEFAGEHVPPLEDVLRLARGKIRLNVELKVNRHGNNPAARRELARKVVDLIRTEDFRDQCVITSLDYHILLDVKEFDPDLPVGLIAQEVVGNAHELKVDFYSIHRDMADRDFVKKAHRLGRPVYVWTVNEPDQMDRLLTLGVDGLITDNPALAMQARDDPGRARALRRVVLRFVGKG